MKKHLPSAAVAAAFATALAVVPAQAQYATQLVSYSTGTGFSTEFGTGLAYSLTSAALGEPSRVTPGQFGGPVDPFNSPYLRDQILSIGTGGSLTVALAAENHPMNPYGRDFQIFGNTAFIITNGDYSGGGITDGSTFGENPGLTRVSVSVDGLTYYQLNPALAPRVDGLFPTLGSGDFQVPVNPALSGADFNGASLADIQLRYGGSGGGTSFDIGWAQDASGVGVNLERINFVRVDVISGKSEIDGLAAIRAVPEPQTWALLGAGAGLLAWSRRRA